MSKIKVTLPPGECVCNGKQVSFLAPCDCTMTEALVIDGTEFTVCDTMGGCVTGIGGAWRAGTLISVILDTVQNKAFLQNKWAPNFKTIASRERDPNKPDYGVGTGTSEVALLTGPYTGTAEITVQVEETEYDAQNMSQRTDVPNGTIIIRKVED